MKRSSKTSRTGHVTWLQLLLGLLIVWLLSLARKNTSKAPSELIKSKLLDAGYDSNFAKWWSAISNFETAKWTSNLYLMYHNLFGMKQPVKRATTSLGPTSDGWASFADDSKSVDDLILYLSARNYPKSFDSLESLVSFMKQKSYFEEPVDYYLNGVKSRL